MPEKNRRLTQRDASFILNALRAETGYVDVTSKTMDAFAAVITHFEDGLGNGWYARPSFLDRLRPRRIYVPVMQSRPLTESLVSGSGWRAFDPTARGVGNFEEVGLTLVQDLFKGIPIKGSNRLFRFDGDSDAARCRFINITEARINYDNQGTAMSFGRHTDPRGSANLTLMVFRTYYENSSKRLQLLDQSLLSFKVVNGITTCFVGFEHLDEQNHPITVYLRITTIDLSSAETIEITTMKAVEKTAPITT